MKDSESFITCRAECCEAAARTERLHDADLARSLTYNASPLIVAFPVYRVALWPGVPLKAQAARRRLKGPQCGMRYSRLARTRA
jgi:hypothetical protein